MKLTADQIIDDILGGTSEAAKVFKISPAAVSQWRRDGIPLSREMYIRVVYRKQVKQLEMTNECSTI